MQEKLIVEEEPGGSKESQEPLSQNQNNGNDDKKQNIAQLISGFISKGFPSKQKHGLRETVEEIIDEIEEEQEDGEETIINSNERSIIKNIIEFSELYVEDILIPRADVFAISAEQDFEKLQSKMVKKTYTRIPVFRKNLDDIIGFIHIKDLARMMFQKKPFVMEELLRQALFVPPSMKVSNLLIKMQMTRVHLAIVVDEYGGTMGIVTLEDLLEEIVGKIDDEHAIDKTFLFRQISENLFEVSGRLAIEEFESKSGIQLISDEEREEGNFDTVGGLIFSILGRIPVVGEIAVYNENTEFEITDADARSLKRVIIRFKNQ
jgi:magnesium and cobalt transporter